MFKLNIETKTKVIAKFALEANEFALFGCIYVIAFYLETIGTN